LAPVRIGEDRVVCGPGTDGGRLGACPTFDDELPPVADQEVRVLLTGAVEALAAEEDAECLAAAARVEQEDLHLDAERALGTHVGTDLAIGGNGYFMVQSESGALQGSSSVGTGLLYTRNGQFEIDEEGYLANLSGLRVQGYQADNTGVFGPGLKAVFSGASTNLFTDFLKDMNHVFHERREGSLVEVLVEGVSPRDPDRFIGRTAYNQIVVFPGSRDLPGRLVKVRVEETTPLTLLGSMVEEVVP